MEPTQPDPTQWRFAELLSRPLWGKHTWTRRAPRAGEVGIAGGVRMFEGFADPRRRLDTAYADLRHFLACGGIPPDGPFRIETHQRRSGAPESFRVHVTPRACRILASDTEGVRRGMFHLEDVMLRAGGPFLPLGVCERQAFIRRRISRCFFGPINRPPMNRDELADWVYDVPAHLPEGVILQANFETGVRRTDFGRPHIGGDYWLAQAGPSRRFEKLARVAVSHGALVSAKIQAGCSHEVATIPYVPVPSQLFRKFKAMRRLGVSHVMLCWYFGNYPGLMNRAAGELSFDPFPRREDVFLRSLARRHWGMHAAPAAAAWRHLAEG